MHLVLGLFLACLALSSMAQDSQPLETPYTPFDFDNYRRNPLQARQNPSSWASKDNPDLQRGLISGERGRKQDISARADQLFEDSKEIPLRQDPQPLPTPNELTDSITAANHGLTTKGQQDLLARGRVAEKLDLSSMSETDYELYVARLRAEQTAETTSPADEGMLRPMPTLTNTKTGGPPHGYSVSQAGVGARAEPRNDQNPFEDLIHAFRLDHPVTKGEDPLPTPPSRLTVAASVPASVPAESAPAASTETPESQDQPKP